MGFSFFPRSAKFFKMFREQNKSVVKAAVNLEDLFHDFKDVEEHCKSINIIESEGNAMARHIGKQLSMTFITPIDREDIHEICLIQEDLLNLIKAIATRIGLYGFSRVTYPSRRLVKNLREMIELAGVALKRLKKNKGDDGSIEKIKSLKYDSETLLLVGLGEIYDCDCLNVVSILDIVKWTHIYDRIEQAVERAEALAEVLEGVMLKNA